MQSSGFNVLLPRWWTGKSAALKVRAKIKSSKKTSKSLLTLDTLLEYQWQLAVGGEPISHEEFEALAALKQPPIMLRGQWVALDRTQVEAALKFFERADDQITLQDALQVGLEGDVAEVAGLPVEQVGAEGWIKTPLAGLKSPEKIEVLPTPAALQGTLRPYQQRGFSWLTFLRQFGLGACLADDMGLGKSVMAIALLLHERHVLQVSEPTLLICPTSVIGNWRRELQRFAPDLRVMDPPGHSAAHRR